MRADRLYPSRFRVHIDRRRSSAFTLIELLVVVSIIALLISILLPSLKRARDQAKDVSCRTNMRSMGQAFAMYAQRFDGVWPAPVDSLGNQNRWPRMFFDADIIDQELNEYDSAGNPLRTGGPSIFLCPAEKAPRAIQDWRLPGNTVDRVEVGGSYAYNEEIQRPAPSATIDRGRVSPPPPQPGHIRKVDYCKRPSAVFALMDNHKPIETVADPGWRYNRGADQQPGGNFVATAGGFWTGYRTFDGDPVTDPNIMKYRIIGDRHLDRLNAMAMDTHVEARSPESIRYNEVSWTRWDGPPDDVPGGQ